MAGRAVAPTGPGADLHEGARVILKPGREGPVRGRNPWIFSHAIERTEPSPLEPGSPVSVVDQRGAPLGVGYYHPRTTIAVRLLSFENQGDLSEIVAQRLRQATELRAHLVSSDSTCYRLINGDGDGLSGLVVDRYGEVVVLQILTAGMERLRSLIVDRLSALLSPRAIIERSSGAVRKEEGLPDRNELVAGESASEVQVLENGWPLVVDPCHGQKTGSFLDQRVNRRWFGQLAAGRRVLDGYCYGGGFGLAALKGGAQGVSAVDTSSRALAWARRNFELNAIEPDRYELIAADLPRYLAQQPRSFDLIALDPPPLARSRKDLRQAEHRYVEINAIAMRALAAGGMMMTFSCSTHVRAEDFLRAVRMAQTQAGVNLRLVASLGAAPDHPTLLGHVEGGYLNGFLLSSLE
jgi:23S rRNA (cytosine1962-C5)-methyltransferase